MIRSEITINPHHRLGDIDPLLYGQFVESLDPPAKPIYGGVVDDDGTLREDVIADLREMRVPVIRWGGNYGDFLHWEESIGPRDKRPMRYNYQWGGRESNQFGTHEFLTLCERLEAEPYININMGTGSLQEALGWLEYCNYDGDTTYTRMRKANGREKPWHVGIWGIGNESWGKWETSFNTPELYADRYNRFVFFMHDFDPSIQFVGVGWLHSHWNETVLKLMDHQPEYLSIHLYGHSHIGADDNYRKLVGVPQFFEKFVLPRVINDVHRFAKKPMGIVVDEWNTRHFFNGKIDRASARRMDDALFSAGFLNVMQRNAAAIRMTNQTCMVNSLAPLIATPTGTIRTPLYEVFRLYQKLTLPRVIGAQVVAPVYHCTPSPCSSMNALITEFDADYLDASVTASEGLDKLSIALVNYHDQESMAVRVRRPDCPAYTSARLWLVTSDAVDSLQARVETQELANFDEVILPPHSFGFLVLE